MRCRKRPTWTPMTCVHLYEDALSHGPSQRQTQTLAVVTRLAPHVKTSVEPQVDSRPSTRLQQDLAHVKGFRLDGDSQANTRVTTQAMPSRACKTSSLVPPSRAASVVVTTVALRIPADLAKSKRYTNASRCQRSAKYGSRTTISSIPQIYAPKMRRKSQPFSFSGTSTTVRCGSKRFDPTEVPIGTWSFEVSATSSDVAMDLPCGCKASSATMPRSAAGASR